MLGENTIVDSVMEKVLQFILAICEGILNFIFSNNFITLFFWFAFMNIIAFVLMMKDKQYAKEEKRRISENTLIAVALIGGALGMYLAMYKFKHKTLHKKFTILVPCFIVFHFAFISYFILSSIMA